MIRSSLDTHFGLRAYKVGHPKFSHKLLISSVHTVYRQIYFIQLQRIIVVLGLLYYYRIRSFPTLPPEYWPPLAKSVCTNSCGWLYCTYICFIVMAGGGRRACAQTILIIFLLSVYHLLSTGDKRPLLLCHTWTGSTQPRYNILSWVNQQTVGSPAQLPLTSNTMQGQSSLSYLYCTLSNFKKIL